jgi:gliding motility-associated-like protein
MRKIILALLFLISATSAFADHLKGGFFTYTYLGAGINNPSYLRYRITLTVYMHCEPSAGQLTDPINFSFFNAATNGFIQDVSVHITSQYDLTKTHNDECISGDHTGCKYRIVIYDLPSIELAPLPNGYTVAYQRCCRVISMQNVTNSNAVGTTYNITIPGTLSPFSASTNSSPRFPVNDTVIVCANSHFQYTFQAVDLDGDSLSYAFCDAYGGGGQSNGTGCGDNSPDPACLPFTTVPYTSPYTGSQPIGALVTINPVTGLIGGIAPGGLGEYVVNVCVSEFRNGVFIASSRKELHVEVQSCNVVQATLDPSYITCDGYTLTFSNNTPNSLIQNYYWDFGVTTLTNDTSNLPVATYTYTDTGMYTVTLIVNKGLACTDTATTIAKVYPGFFPGFVYSGICANHPTQFTDTTKTNYGVVNTWRWDFGVTTLTNDTSHLQNPVFTYPIPGTYNVQFIVSNSKGCIDTISKPVDILDKPPLNLAFRDTIICIGDQVQLHAIGNGVFSWTPLVNITNPNTPDPTVNPPGTTIYHVNLNDQGCVNNDSVRVRVITQVTLNAFSDSTICKGDSAFLHATGDGLHYQWSPAASLNNAALQNPIAVVNNTTTYQVTSIVGSCSATKSVTITTVPYPQANAGPDTTICFRTFAQLQGSMVASNFSWSPAGSLNNPASLSPIATPPKTTAYVLSVTDNLGCPKPGKDTVVVTVLPKVNAFAGHDTSVVVGQPLHFNASGGVNYLWSPVTALSDPGIHNPVGIYDGSFTSIRYRVLVTDAKGCADSAFITVKIFDVHPQIFVPTAFTPNGDGLNDVIRPIGVGIKTMEYFRIFNRWGQLVFSTSINEDGWDGKIGGKEQGTNTFVWIVKGIDYLDRPFFMKGTVTLIR